MEYLIRWEIDIEADTPQEAVEIAASMMPGPGNKTSATFFEVLDPNDESVITTHYLDQEIPE